MAVIDSSGLPARRSGFAQAFSDLGYALARPWSWSVLGFSDILFRYRRTVIGPFWLTLSTAVLVTAVGLIYAGLFRAPIAQYVPYLAVGSIAWGYMNVVMNEGANVFIQSNAIIKSMPTPLMTHVLRMLLRNMIVLAHQLVIIVGIWIYFGWHLSAAMWMALPAFVLITIFLFGMSLGLGVLCTRFRDVPQVILSALQVLFLITPIMWRAEDARYGRFMLDYNPFYYLLEIIRDPLMNRQASLLEWEVSASAAAIMLITGLWAYGRYSSRIAYWL